MEPKMVKATSDDVPSSDDSYGNKFLPQRDIRGGNTVESTSAAYGGLPESIKKTGGIDCFEHPSRESQYAKVADDKDQGASKPWRPKGRKD